MSEGSMVKKFGWAAVALFASVATFGAAPAKAAVFDLTIDPGQVFTLSATVDATYNFGAGDYNITSIVGGGTSGGTPFTITNLVPADSNNTSPDGLFYYDNIIIPISQPFNTFDVDGLLFDASNGVEYNVFTDNVSLSTTVFNLAAAWDSNVGYTNSFAETGSLIGPLSNGASSGPSGVPETSTWLMMLVGFGLVGLQLSRRKTVNA
jgi:hypothetical protein